ncbi:MAG: NapC/NirT family cytochrome c [Acidobacteriota bacterium]|nr:NapC/NirT family cytochrome c [Acidobacteriota bacterium]
MSETLPPAEPASPVGVLRNPITIAGAVLTTISVLLFLAFFLIELSGVIAHENPYLGIVFFITLPALAVLGLLMIPLGVWRERRRRLAGLAPSLREWPRIDLNNSHTRAILFGIAVLTPVNLLILSAAAYKGVEAMDSVEFCGATCHEVMEPEYVAYQNGPHARVKCVSCHIGSGAGWFAKSKLSGTRQVFAVMLNTHSRPIPSPVHDLRPARETCAECHWPAQFHGDKIETRHEFADDEANTESITTLRLRIGGIDGTGRPGGIHWHVAEENVVEYIALDRERQNIGYVKLTTADGETREYYSEGVTEAQLAVGERRRMDCVDCHNRPSHAFARSADRAVNEAMASGAIAKDLPFAKREAVAALTVPYPDRATADREIANRVSAFYRDGYPALWTSRQADIERAVKGVQTLHSRNVFPAMKVTFGTHPDNKGHMEFPGCFRCHNDEHKTRDGKVISQDCSTCHEVS